MLMNVVEQVFHTFSISGKRWIQKTAINIFSMNIHLLSITHEIVVGLKMSCMRRKWLDCSIENTLMLLLLKNNEPHHTHVLVIDW